MNCLKEPFRSRTHVTLRWSTRNESVNSCWPCKTIRWYKSGWTSTQVMIWSRQEPVLTHHQERPVVFNRGQFRLKWSLHQLLVYVSKFHIKIAFLVPRRQGTNIIYIIESYSIYIYSILRLEYTISYICSIQLHNQVKRYSTYSILLVAGIDEMRLSRWISKERINKSATAKWRWCFLIAYFRPLRGMTKFSDLGIISVLQFKNEL